MQMRKKTSVQTLDFFELSKENEHWILKKIKNKNTMLKKVPGSFEIFVTFFFGQKIFVSSTTLTYLFF